MKITDTISVNPSKTTMGQVENAASIFRSPVIDRHSSLTFDPIKVLFPTTGLGINEYKKYETPLRTLFATILIVTGISMLTSFGLSEGIGFAVCTLSFGAFLALGLLTRPVMLGASIYYCIMGALGLRAGAPDLTVFSLMFGCLIFGVIGAGKYSCDTLIRGAILRNKRASVRRNKENYMGYKAFHKVKF